MYLRTDEEFEAAEALRMAAQMAEEARHNLSAWRWVVVSLHNAVQGFMVLSLRHGNGLLALTDKCAEKWLEAYENDTAYPKDKLDSYLNLYKKVKNEETGRFGGNANFVPAGQQGKNIKRQRGRVLHCHIFCPVAGSSITSVME